MNNKKLKSRTFGRERRGVGAIIGGVILAGIILTSVLTFFVSILQNETARTSYEIQSQTDTREKQTETYTVDRELTVTAGSVPVNINNTGSIPMVASHALVYCSSGAGCTTPGKAIQDLTVSEVLNPGDAYSTTLGGGLMSSGNTYTISVISERGNIISSTTCTLRADDTCEEDHENIGPGMEAIAQGTGEVQLDFKSFAAIFPDFMVRNGVDQTGKYTKASEVKGYPGTNLYGDVDTIIVQRVRFINDDDEQLRLTKNTAFIAAFGGTKGNHPHLAYICSTTGDPITLPSSIYNNDVLLEDVPFPYDTALGWHNIYFCRDSDGDGLPLGAIDSWRPNTDYSLGINPVFMVMRAKFEGSQIDYAQTIPYQAFQINGARDGTIADFIACIYSSNTNPGNCDAQTSAATAGRPYIYQASAGTQVYIHVNTGTSSGTSPYYVEWIENDGTNQCLSGVGSPCPSATINGFRNIAVTIPAGTPAGYYILKVTDSSVAYGTAKVVLMTFQVT